MHYHHFLRAFEFNIGRQLPELRRQLPENDALVTCICEDHTALISRCQQRR